VRDLIIFLEDRRSLFGPLMERVDPYYAAHSVDTIRNELTRTLQRLPEEAKSAILIDDMRAACRVFVDVVGSPHDERRTDRQRSNIALGELRATLGVNIAVLADKFGIEVRGPLRELLPAVADSAEGEDGES